MVNIESAPTVTLLRAFDTDLLQEAECFLAGGMAIALPLGGYRDSASLFFLCASDQGHRLLRNTVSSELGRLLKHPVKHFREVRTDQYRISTFLEVEGMPVKVELVKEDRVAIGGEIDSTFGVPVLARVDLYVQKLLANADRGQDRAVNSRDIIDLAMMVRGWGGIPELAWRKAYSAYGPHLSQAFHQSVAMVGDRPHLANCLQRLGMDAAWVDQIPDLLEDASSDLNRLGKHHEDHS